MQVDMIQVRTDLQEVLSRNNAAESDKVSELSRRIQQDVWRRVSLGEIGRPSLWLDVLRPVFSRTSGAPAQIRATLDQLEELLGIAAAGMPQRVPSVERPRGDLESRLVSILADAPKPLTLREIEGELRDVVNDLDAREVRRSIETLEIRRLVLRDAQAHGGTQWQMSPGASGVIRWPTLLAGENVLKSVALRPWAAATEMFGVIHPRGPSEGAGERGNESSDSVFGLRSIENALPAARPSVIFVGSKFKDTAESLGVTVPPLALAQVRDNNQGRWAVATESEANMYVGHWLRKATHRYRAIEPKADRAKLAALMNVAAPHDIRTLAAMWGSAQDSTYELSRQRNLVGHIADDPRWKHRLARVLQEELGDPWHGLHVVAFAGGTGTLRGEVARRLHNVIGVGWGSFGEEIERTAEIASDTRRIDKETLMRIGQHAVDAAPFTLVTDVLAQSVVQAQRTVIVDGLRHARILQLLQWLFPDSMTLWAVNANPETRAERLKERSLTADILQDPTEREISVVEKAAPSDNIFNDRLGAREIVDRDRKSVV